MCRMPDWTPATGYQSVRHHTLVTGEAYDRISFGNLCTAAQTACLQKLSLQIGRTTADSELPARQSA